MVKKKCKRHFLFSFAWIYSTAYNNCLILNAVFIVSLEHISFNFHWIDAQNIQHERNILYETTIEAKKLNESNEKKKLLEKTDLHIKNSHTNKAITVPLSLSFSCHYFWLNKKSKTVLQIGWKKKPVLHNKIQSDNINSVNIKILQKHNKSRKR